MPKYTDAAAALADGCLHYWPMDAVLGSEVIEDRIGGMNGGLNPEFAYEADDTIYPSTFGSARSITHHGSGASEVAVVNIDPAQTGHTTHTYLSSTVRLRFFLNSQSGENDLLTLGNTSGSGQGSLRLYLYGSALYILHSQGNIGPAALQLNQWHEVVASWWWGSGNYGTLTLFVDGAEIGTLDITNSEGGFNPYSNIIGVGSRSGAGHSSYNIDGLVDELAFWDRVMFAPEVAELWNGGASTPILETMARPEPPVYEVLAGVGATSYHLTLTGSADGETDLELPISSFNARVRSASESYLSAVIPNASHLIEGIAARSNGDLILTERQNGEDVEIITVNFGDMREDHGAKSGATVSVSGHKQVTYESEKLWTINNASYFSRSQSQIRLRVKARAAIRPTDVVTAQGVQFVVQTVNYIGSINRVYMELSDG